MNRERSLSAPRRVLALFLAITVLPGLALAWLGWQLLEQDRSLTGQRIQEQLDREALRVVAEIDERLRQIQADLPVLMQTAGRGLAAGALVVEIDATRLAALPADRLLFRPSRPVVPADSGSVFAAGEALEFKEQDLAGAIETYRALTGDDNDGIRAGALLRLARSERKLGQLDQALGHYDDLAHIHDAELAGGPADLLARQARLGILEALGDTSLLLSEARALADDLLRAYWALDRAAFELHVQKVRSVLGRLNSGDDSLAVPADRLTLAETVEALMQQSLSGEDVATSTTFETPAGAVLVIANQDSGPLQAFIATPAHLLARWRGGWHDRGIVVQLIGANNRTFLATGELAGQRSSSGSNVTKLPWDVGVAYLDPSAAFGQLDQRRHLLLIGFGLILLLVFGGGYFAVRGISREVAAAQLQTDFVSAVSHEFRSPLTSMRHVTELLAEGAVPTESRRNEYYGLLLRQTERLHRLVTNLLDFRRLESGAYDYHFDEVDPGELVANVVDDFENLSGGSHSVRLEIAANLPGIRADSEALSRAIWNLLDNAAKYSPDSPAIDVCVKREADAVRIRVADEGVGIPADSQQRIFEKFVRAQRDETSHVEGAGIGLTMVRQIVEAHGGRIGVESVVGKGSTFILSLPIGARS